MDRRVVITGMGAVTPLGSSAEAYWQGLKAGRVGIGPITKFDTEAFEVKLAAEVRDFDPKERLGRKAAKRMSPFAQYAVAAALEAAAQAGLDMEKEDPWRVGVSVGSGIGGILDLENEHQKLLDKGPDRVSPMLVPMMITNMAAGNIAIRLGAKGKNINVVTACATGAHSIGEAFRAIRCGEADVMIAGGSEAAITPLAVAGFTTLQALSKATDPMAASLPFDSRRSGFVMGEGAGILILEDEAHARARGAHILAELAGYGATCDAYHITSPAEDGSGAARAMQLAMAEAGVTPAQVDYINAHGTGTHYNDLFETRAIRLALGEADARRVKISSSKSMVGHMLGAAGAVELIACVRSIEEDYIHPTAGLSEADPECDLDYVPEKGLEMPVRYALSNSLGFGGHNASLLVKAWEA